jgi:hypothetical protein
MPKWHQMVEQLPMSQQPQNQVFAYDNHLLFWYDIFNDYLSQMSLGFVQ